MTRLAETLDLPKPWRLLLLAAFQIAIVVGLAVMVPGHGPPAATTELVVTLSCCVFMIGAGLFGLFFRRLSKKIDMEMAEAKRDHDAFMARVKALLDRKAASPAKEPDWHLEPDEMKP